MKRQGFRLFDIRLTTSIDPGSSFLDEKEIPVFGAESWVKPAQARGRVRNMLKDIRSGYEALYSGKRRAGRVRMAGARRSDLGAGLIEGQGILDVKESSSILSGGRLEVVFELYLVLSTENVSDLASDAREKARTAALAIRKGVEEARPLIDLCRQAAGEGDLTRFGRDWCQIGDNRIPLEHDWTSIILKAVRKLGDSSVDVTDGAWQYHLDFDEDLTRPLKEAEVYERLAIVDTTSLTRTQMKFWTHDSNRTKMIAIDVVKTPGMQCDDPIQTGDVGITRLVPQRAALSGKDEHPVHYALEAFRHVNVDSLPEDWRLVYNLLMNEVESMR